MWMVLWIPYLRAQAHARPPRGLDEQAHLAQQADAGVEARSLKSCSTMPFSITGAPASTFTPPGRSCRTPRCAAQGLPGPPRLCGRPGRCTSPAEIMVVTPPFRRSIRSSRAGFAAASSRRTPGARGCRSGPGPRRCGVIRVAGNPPGCSRPAGDESLEDGNQS